MASSNPRAHVITTTTVSNARTRTITTTTTVMSTLCSRPTHIRLPSPTPLLVYGSEPSSASTIDTSIETPQSARFFDWSSGDKTALVPSFPRPPSAPPKSLDPRWTTYVAYQLNHYGSKRDSVFHATLRDLSRTDGEDVARIVRRHLRAVHDSGRRSAVLDVGTGTGVWAREVTKEQEYANVIGIDFSLDRVQYAGKPANLAFEQIDIRQPMPYNSDYFDIVHIRNVNMSISNYLLFVERCARILRKGGLLIITECDPVFSCAWRGYTPGFSYRTWKTALRMAMQAQNVDPAGWERLAEHVNTSTIFDPSPVVETLEIPVGREHLDSDYVEAYFQALEPCLLEHNYKQSDVLKLIEESVAELTEADDRYYQTACTVIARKRDF